MFKKFFTSKLTYLVLLFVINISALICVCIYTIKPLDQGQEYIPNNDDYIEPTTSCRYMVQERDFIKYQSYNATVVDNANIYNTYILDTTSITIGDDISEGDLLGKYLGEDVFSSYDSFCLNVIENEEKYEVIVYNYNQFSIQLSLNSRDYYNFDTTNEEIFLKCNDIQTKVVFKGYDYSLFKTQNRIVLKFQTENCKYLINSNMECTLEVKEAEYNKMLCLPASIFNYQTYHKMFYVLQNEQYIPIYVEALEFIDDYALIASSDNSLCKGMFLYLYE
ncbi:MAG: hypothetical protein ACI311_06665 [Bacilli bacterium]